MCRVTHSRRQPENSSSVVRRHCQSRQEVHQLQSPHSNRQDLVNRTQHEQDTIFTSSPMIAKSVRSFWAMGERSRWRCPVTGTRHNLQLTRHKWRHPPTITANSLSTGTSSLMYSLDYCDRWLSIIEKLVLGTRAAERANCNAIFWGISVVPYWTAL